MSNCLTCCASSGWALIDYILYCHILWWAFYFFLLVVTRQNEEWCCRCLTFVHGCLVSYSAISDVFANNCPMECNSVPLSQNKKNYLSYMLSYFLFDLCWIHFFGNETWVIYAHHMISIFMIVNILLKNYGGAGVSYGVAGLELTNPYLQMRWFLRTHGYLHKPIHTIVELWFMILFFIIRIIGGTTLLYYTLVVSTAAYEVKLSFTAIYAISLVLQWQIFVYFRKKYLGRGGVNFINSRVSISPYFQRRVLDNVNNDDETESHPATNGTVVMPVTTEVFPTKEGDSTEKMVASTISESKRGESPKSGRSVISVKKEESVHESPEETQNPEESHSPEETENPDNN